MKKCTKCGEEKPLEDFSRDRRTKDGRQYRCRLCQKARLSATRATRRAEGLCGCGQPPITGYAQCADCRERFRLYVDSGRSKGRLRARRDAGVCYRCPAPAVPGRGGRCDRHADEEAARTARRVDWARQEYLAIVEFEDGNIGPCDYAGIPELGPCSDDLHLDHAYPLSRGGPDEPWNLALVCGRHNQAKSARTPSEYLAAHGVEVDLSPFAR